ncbi:MAG: hypothetical protein JWM98_1013, partial [Thermoleophilia bacterium]|nr:hypothetical protein [Thermoleophilia bacterium]
KLLPQFMQSGHVATALEWGMNANGMLDMGNDIRIVRDFLQHKPPLPAVNPAAMEQLVAAGQHPAMAGAMVGLGKELREGTLQMVEGTENAAVLNTKLGALQLVPKDTLHKAFAATDPVQSAGVAMRGKIDSGVVNGLGLLKGLVQPAMIGASALGLVSSIIGVKNLVATKGKDALLETQQGRGAVLGAVSSVSYLGMYLVPMAMQALKVAVPAVAAASSAINIAANVLGGIQMLNSYGLFGGEQAKNGFLDNDAFRAAFLIPPLTPIGGFAFWLKSKRKKAAAEAAQLEAAKKIAVDRVAQQREMAKLQLQSGGAVSGSTAGADGTINVATGIPQDLSLLAAQLGGAAGAAAPAPAAAAGAAPAAAPAAAAGGDSALAQQREQLTMTAKPMR